MYGVFCVTNVKEKIICILIRRIQRAVNISEKITFFTHNFVNYPLCDVQRLLRQRVRNKIERRGIRKTFCKYNGGICSSIEFHSVLGYYYYLMPTNCRLSHLFTVPEDMKLLLLQQVYVSNHLYLFSKGDVLNSFVNSLYNRVDTGLTQY